MRNVLGALARPQTYVGQAREAISVAHCLARYPLGLLEPARPRGSATRTVHDTPVLLVHGYGHNHSAWWVLERQLRRAGFRQIHTFDYLPQGSDVPGLAARLGDRIEAICRETGAAKLHVVGHSLGGVLLRWYVQELGGERRVATAVTLGSPHQGTKAAYLAVGRTARDLRPDSPVVRRLRAGARPTGVRWIAFYSNIDLLVQPAVSGKLLDPALGATNILVKDHGHLSMLLSPTVVRAVVEQLQAAEGVPGMATITELRPAPAPVAAATPLAEAR